MDKLSNILFLVTIIAGIISLIRKTMKQPSVKDILSHDEVFPAQPPLIVDKPIQRKKIITQVTPRISVPEQEQQIISEQSVEIQELEEDGGISIDLSDPEEVKRAIIYSEIFNKKDIY